MSEQIDWAALERIEARLAAEKSRLARLSAESEAHRATLERVAEVATAERAPWWLVRWL
jgi:hypothetical protein